MPQFIVILIFFIGIVYSKLNRTSSIGIMKMSSWLIISYSFLIITHIFSGITYYSGSIARIFPYFMLCLLLLVVGEKIGMRTKSKFVKKKLKINLNKIAYISILGITLFVIDLIRLNTIFFGSRIDDFKISIIGLIGNILSSFGIIAWLIGLYENRINNVKITLLSYLSILSYVLGGILSAGRQAIIIITLASIIMMIWSRRKRKELLPINYSYINKKKKPWGIVIIISIFISYFLFISSVRSGIFDINDKMNMFESGFNAKISNETLNDVYHLPALSDFYIEFLFYYSHELRRLDLFYQLYDYPPLFGLGQFSYIERRFQWLFGNLGDLSWKEVEFALEQKGHFGSHTWGTFITNYIIDFGRLGALIACLITGIIIGLLYRNLKDNESAINIVRHCLLLAGIVFSIQFSPFLELGFTFPLIISSFLKINITTK